MANINLGWTSGIPVAESAPNDLERAGAGSTGANFQGSARHREDHSFIHSDLRDAVHRSIAHCGVQSGCNIFRLLNILFACAYSWMH